MTDTPFQYQAMFPTDEHGVNWRQLSDSGVSTVDCDGKTFLKVSDEALRLLSETAFHDIAHFLRPGHLQQLRNILDDNEASENDKFVALDLLKMQMSLPVVCCRCVSSSTPAGIVETRYSSAFTSMGIPIIMTLVLSILFHLGLCRRMSFYVRCGLPSGAEEN